MSVLDQYIIKVASSEEKEKKPISRASRSILGGALAGGAISGTATGLLGRKVSKAMENSLGVKLPVGRYMAAGGALAGGLHGAMSGVGSHLMNKYSD